MIHRQFSVIKSHVELVKDYKDLKHKIKVLEKQADEVKQTLIDHYFKNTDTLYDDDGLVISTYKSSVRVSFESSKFKIDQPELYNKYLDIKEINTFLVK